MNVIKALQIERRNLSQQLNALDQAINLLSSHGKHVHGKKHVKRHLSAAARNRISLAQKKRWAKVVTLKKRAA